MRLCTIPSAAVSDGDADVAEAEPADVRRETHRATLAALPPVRLHSSWCHAIRALRNDVMQADDVFATSSDINCTATCTPAKQLVSDTAAGYNICTTAKRLVSDAGLRTTI